MGKVGIVTDSAAYLEPGVARHLGITVIPLTIRFGDKALRHGIDITTEGFLRRFKRSSTPPIVLPPSVELLEGVYTKLSRTTDEILSIHVSSKLNPFFQEARSAATALLGRCQIVVMDSLTTSLGLGILVTAAAKAAEEGRSLSEIIHLVRGMIPRIYGAFVTERLDFLERDKRIDKAQAILGTMLGIKPFLTIEEGEIIPIEKVLTREEALDRLFEFVTEFSYLERVAVVQSIPHPTEETKFLIEQLEMAFPDLNFPILLYDPVLASHIGPDAIGVIVYEGL